MIPFRAVVLVQLVQVGQLHLSVLAQETEGAHQGCGGPAAVVAQVDDDVLHVPVALDLIKGVVEHREGAGVQVLLGGELSVEALGPGQVFLKAVKVNHAGVPGKIHPGGAVAEGLEGPHAHHFAHQLHHVRAHRPVLHGHRVRGDGEELHRRDEQLLQQLVDVRHGFKAEDFEDPVQQVRPLDGPLRVDDGSGQDLSVVAAVKQDAEQLGQRLHIVLGVRGQQGLLDALLAHVGVKAGDALFLLVAVSNVQQHAHGGVVIFGVRLAQLGAGGEAAAVPLIRVGVRGVLHPLGAVDAVYRIHDVKIIVPVVGQPSPHRRDGEHGLGHREGGQHIVLHFEQLHPVIPKAQGEGLSLRLDGFVFDRRTDGEELLFLYDAAGQSPLGMNPDEGLPVGAAELLVRHVHRHVHAVALDQEGIPLPGKITHRVQGVRKQQLDVFPQGYIGHVLLPDELPGGQGAGAVQRPLEHPRLPAALHRQAGDLGCALLRQHPGGRQAAQADRRRQDGQAALP